MYEDRSLAQAEPTAEKFGASAISLRVQAAERASGELGTLVLKNVLVWGSAAISCGIIYLMVTLFI